MRITEKQRLALAEKLAGKGKRATVDRGDAVKRYLAGESVAAIAALYGVTEGAVYIHLRKARDEK